MSTQNLCYLPRLMIKCSLHYNSTLRYIANKVVCCACGGYRCIDEAGVVDVIGIVFAIIGGKEGERETDCRVCPGLTKCDRM